LLLGLASKDEVRVEHVLAEETREILKLFFRQCGEPLAETPDQFVSFMVKISESRRGQRINGEERVPPSVFVAAQSVWVHVPSLRQWLSLPSFYNKLFPLSDLRNGLLLLGFKYRENVTRACKKDGAAGKVSLCLWEGNLDALIDDVTEDEKP
jgi:hypothetical protein